jgi:hypothetical protein
MTSTTSGSWVVRIGLELEHDVKDAVLNRDWHVNVERELTRDRRSGGPQCRGSPLSR